jgi:hypothetical protein
MRIDSSGRVMVGTTTADGILKLDNTGQTSETLLTTEDTGGSGAHSHITLKNTTGIVASLLTTSDNLEFRVDDATVFANISGTESMRIDATGNLLVGTTDPIAGINGSSTQGVALSSGSYGGVVLVSRDGNTPIIANRQTSDGTIQEFRKDGTSVGIIGTSGSKLFIGSFSGANPSALKFQSQTSPVIHPCTVNGSNSDNVQSLGQASARFKDLYLGGGLYVGGTAAANLLDDYEEGTFTPTIEGSSTAGTATYSDQVGKYTKIGNAVTIQIQLGYSSGTGSGTAMYIKGLPFTSSSAVVQSLAIAYTNNITIPANRFVTANIGTSNNYIRLFTDEVGGGASNDLAYDGAGDIAVGGTYFI